jgi:hypothetical protein
VQWKRSRYLAPRQRFAALGFVQFLGGEQVSIDYARMQKSGPKLKAALTRAIKKGGYEPVALACKAAVQEWDAIGAWPDNWSLWQRALDDSAFKSQLIAPRLEDL